MVPDEARREDVRAWLHEYLTPEKPALSLGERVARVRRFLQSVS